ncbi:hypothetical protein ABZ802_31320 [Streptomyces sp. NPDC047737]|uniref:hypothetical protein n=1 Tax=Streptomyces sp. NPDC047737 TaxID=3155740 RepID=UPI0033FC645F
MCPQCQTRHDDWDHGGPDEEDAWAVTTQLCVGCQVLADKQQELARDRGEDTHGLKVALIPAAAAAAIEVEREEQKRRRHGG